jgi:peptidoglycan biosynthesis protein MviN/MurJ (putative lipid II flippase)
MDYFFRGFRMTLAVTLPAAVGLGLLAEPILSVLFEWGQFGPSQVKSASTVLLISSLGLPLYAVSAFMVKAFHSQKKMIHPLRAALISLIANAVLSVWLMQDHGVYGLALANVLAALTFIQKQPLFFLPILFSSLLMGVILYLLNDWITLPAGKGSDIAKLFLFIPMGAFCYFLFCYASRVPEARSLGAKMTKSLPFGGRL